MASKGTPIRTFPWKVDEKMRKKSYEVRLRALNGDITSQRKLESYNRMVKERRMEASNKDWMIDGNPVNRYKMMEMLVARVSSGESLPQVCSDESYPSLQTVYSWFKNHPDFERAMTEAEAVRGHILGEQALKIALDTDRENVAADKLKVEVLSKFAARSNQRFQDKQVVQNTDEYATMSEQKIKERIQALLAMNPDLVPETLKALGAPERSQLVLTCVPEDQDQSQPQSPDEASESTTP